MVKYYMILTDNQSDPYTVFSMYRCLAESQCTTVSPMSHWAAKYMGINLHDKYEMCQGALVVRAVRTDQIVIMILSQGLYYTFIVNLGQVRVGLYEFGSIMHMCLEIKGITCLCLLAPASLWIPTWL